MWKTNFCVEKCKMSSTLNKRILKVSLKTNKLSEGK